MPGAGALTAPVRTFGILTLGVLITFQLADSPAPQSDLLLRVLAGGAWLLLVLWRPRVGAVLLLVAGATVLPYGSLQASIAGHATSLVEITIYELIGLWLLGAALGRYRASSPFSLAIGLLLLGTAVGTIVGRERGTSPHDLFGWFKLWSYYALALPFAALFDTESARAWFSRWIVRLSVLGTALTLFVVATHVSLPFVGTRPYAVGTLGFQEVGVVRVRPDLVALLVLATLLVAADVALSGANKRNVSALALFAALHLLSFTRSTWAPLLLALLLLAWAHPGRRRRFRGIRALLLLVAVTAALFASASAGIFGATGEAAARRASSIVTPRVLTEASFTSRESENSSAVAALSHHFFAGVGVGQSYGHTEVVYLPNPPRLVVERPILLHNQYYFAWLQLGLLGPLALVAVAAIALRQARQALSQLPPVAAARCLAGALALMVYLLQFLLQTTLLYPANILAVVTAMTLAAPLVTATTPPRRRALSLLEPNRKQ